MDNCHSLNVAKDLHSIVHHVFNKVISVQTGRIIKVAGFSLSVLLVGEAVGIQ